MGEKAKRSITKKRKIIENPWIPAVNKKARSRIEVALFLMAILKESGYLSFKLLCQHRFGHGTNLFVDNLPAFENEQRRNASDAVSSGNVGVLVDVEFSDYHFPFIVGGKLLDHRAYHLTGATPFGPKIDQYRLIRIDGLVEVGIIKYNCFAH